MSTRGVQRVIDRLMSDARYRRDFLESFDDSVAGFELTDEEKKMLAALNTGADDFARQLDDLIPEVVGQWGDHGWER